MKGIKIMNKKQMISMWCGITAFVLVGLTAADRGMSLSHLGPKGGWQIPGSIILWICISVVTAGLIYTFRDKKKPEDKD